jgi:hypothetical protein
MTSVGHMRCLLAVECEQLGVLRGEARDEGLDHALCG